MGDCGRFFARPACPLPAGMASHAVFINIKRIYRPRPELAEKERSMQREHGRTAPRLSTAWRFAHCRTFCQRQDRRDGSRACRPCGVSIIYTNSNRQWIARTLLVTLHHHVYFFAGMVKLVASKVVLSTVFLPLINLTSSFGSGVVKTSVRSKCWPAATR